MYALILNYANNHAVFAKKSMWKQFRIKTFYFLLTLKLSNYLFLTFSGWGGGFFVLELLSKRSKQQQQQQLYNWISEMHNVVAKAIRGT